MQLIIVRWDKWAPYNMYNYPLDQQALFVTESYLIPPDPTFSFIGLISEIPNALCNVTQATHTVLYHWQIGLPSVLLACLSDIVEKGFAWIRCLRKSSMHLLEKFMRNECWIYELDDINTIISAKVSNPQTSTLSCFWLVERPKYFGYLDPSPGKNFWCHQVHVLRNC